MRSISFRIISIKKRRDNFILTFIYLQSLFGINSELTLFIVSCLIGSEKEGLITLIFGWTNTKVSNFWGRILTKAKGKVPLLNFSKRRFTEDLREFRKTKLTISNSKANKNICTRESSPGRSSKIADFIIQKENKWALDWKESYIAKV